MNDSHVKIMCPNLLCRKVLSVPGAARGKTVRCKSCATVIRIPERQAEAAGRPLKDATAPAPKPGKDQAA